MALSDALVAIVKIFLRFEKTQGNGWPMATGWLIVRARNPFFDVGEVLLIQVF